MVVLVGGTLTAANVPNSLEAARVNFYRSMWVAALAGWGLIVWTAASQAQRHLSARTPNLTPGYGARRTRPPEPDEVEVLILSGQGVVDPVDGELIVRLTLPDEPGGEEEAWGDDLFEVWVPDPEP